MKILVIILERSVFHQARRRKTTYMSGNNTYYILET